MSHPLIFIKSTTKTPSDKNIFYVPPLYTVNISMKGKDSKQFECFAGKYKDKKIMILYTVHT